MTDFIYNIYNIESFMESTKNLVISWDLILPMVEFMHSDNLTFILNSAHYLEYSKYITLQEVLQVLHAENVFELYANATEEDYAAAEEFRLACARSVLLLRTCASNRMTESFKKDYPEFDFAGINIFTILRDPLNVLNDLQVDFVL